ncbi:MAG TPA: GAF domain-containing sensor histidine kinase [Baekduia sp.]|nr:GAF domain-containing sensor histidine kinase [Baekduia sp.]
MDPKAREVLSLARSVLSDLDLEHVLGQVLAAARDLTAARYAALGVLDEDRTALARFITVGVDGGTRATIGNLPTGRGVLGELIINPRPLRIDDVGAHPHSYGFPLGHPPMTTFLGVPILVDGQPYGNLYLTEKDGGAPFTDDDEETVCALADIAGVAIDHARRFSWSEGRRRDLEQTVAAFDATMQIAQALAGETDLEAILRLVAKRGRALVSARALVIEFWQDGELVIGAAAGEVPPGVVGQRVDHEGSVAGAAIRSARTQQLDDGPNRRRFERHGLGRLGIEAASGLVVPLMFRGRAFGVLVAIDRLVEGPEFTPDDRRLLESFAASAASAVATAESALIERQQQRLAAAEQERGRWARELHDETLQDLAALRIGLATAARTAEPDDPLTPVLSEAVERLDDEIAALRALITDLRPAALDELGVGAAVRALAERATAAGLEVDVGAELAYEEGRADDRLAPEVEIAAYRIVQEALTNARKHGGAHRAVVEIEETSSTLRVSVRDDGGGFDPDAGTAGFGLLGMRERAELLRGRLRVESQPGGGATITATLPARRRGRNGTRPGGPPSLRPVPGPAPVHGMG